MGARTGARRVRGARVLAAIPWHAAASMGTPPGRADELTRRLVDAVAAARPEVQAVYLFGSFGTQHERPDSDVDVGLLLPPAARDVRAADELEPLRLELERLLLRDVDLIDLRRAPVVLQKEIIAADRRVVCRDERAADEFELYVLSRYQSFARERRELVADGLRSGRFLGP